MPDLNGRIKGSRQHVLGCIGIAAILFAAPTIAAAQNPGAEVAPDNSKKNIRDSGGQSPTPLDQGGSAEDTKITRDIRREILRQKGLSINGKNVKIITIDHLVTLRGPVASMSEKSLITDIATRIAGPAHVKNELEVK